MLSKQNLAKGKVGGSKALGDLTNSIKPPPHQEQAPIITKKLNSVAEENVPSSLEAEGFYCIVAPMKAVDMDYFLKSVGLNKGNNNHYHL